MSDTKPGVLLMPEFGFLEPSLRQAYTVFQPAGSLEAFAASADGRSIRAVITAGARPLPRPLASLPALGLVALVGSGYDGLDVAALRARGVQIAHSPGANADDVADHAVGLLLALQRRIVEGDGAVRRGDWSRDADCRDITSIGDLSVGVAGLGLVGAGIARRMAAFGCATAWFGPHAKPHLALPRFASILELAQASDVLFVSVRGDPANRRLVSAPVIEALGPRGVLVNVSRGFVVDEPALIGALRAGRLGGAALDVFETEPAPTEVWADVPRTILTPHLAGVGTAARRRMAELVAENLKRFFAGSPLAHPVP